jgi:hypothetical protein
VKVEPRGVHLGQRGQMRGIAEVIGIRATGQGGTGRRFNRDDANLLPAAQLRADKGEGDAGEIGAAAGAGHDHIGIVVRPFPTAPSFQPDHRLMQQHMVQHRAKRVFGVVALDGDFHRLGNSDAETARMIRTLGENRSAASGFFEGEATQRAP